MSHQAPKAPHSRRGWRSASALPPRESATGQCKCAGGKRSARVGASSDRHRLAKPPVRPPTPRWFEWPPCREPIAHRPRASPATAPWVPMGRDQAPTRRPLGRPSPFGTPAPMSGGCLRCRRWRRRPGMAGSLQRRCRRGPRRCCRPGGPSPEASPSGTAHRSPGSPRAPSGPRRLQGPGRPARSPGAIARSHAPCGPRP
mmetsp:Transcript_48527/g.103971  ORF Transcript_48527/g.103971 Transcript_48527/m.103971 type:complete len:200 (+) Transcript_48527:93-692(+)